MPVAVTMAIVVCRGGRGGPSCRGARDHCSRSGGGRGCRAVRGVAVVVVVVVVVMVIMVVVVVVLASSWFCS